MAGARSTGRFYWGSAWPLDPRACPEHSEGRGMAAATAPAVLSQTGSGGSISSVPAAAATIQSTPSRASPSRASSTKASSSGSARRQAAVTKP
jgi:hypothetical protein